MAGIVNAAMHDPDQMDTGGGVNLLPDQNIAPPANSGGITLPPGQTGVGGTTQANDTGVSGQTQAPGSSSNTPSLSTSGTPDTGAVTHEVGANETVAGQLHTLLDSGSPLMESARERAKQYASSRGLVNSAMAGQAGEEAMVNTATPIATSDAGTFSRQALVNMDAQNQERSQTRALTGQEKLAQQERDFQGGESAKQRDFQGGEGAKERAARENLTNLSIAGQREISQINASGQQASANADRAVRESQIASNERVSAGEWANRLQVAGIDSTTREHLAQMGIDATTTNNLANLSQNTLTNVGNQVAAIQSNPNMSSEDRATAVRNLLALYAGSPYAPPNIANVWTAPGATNTGEGNQTPPGPTNTGGG